MENIIMGAKYFVVISDVKGAEGIEPVRALEKKEDDYTKFLSLNNGDVFGIHKSRIFDNKEDALQYLNVIYDDVSKQLASKITNVSELLLFILDHDISPSDGYVAYLARTVAVEKMKEFGLNLDYQI